MPHITKDVSARFNEAVQVLLETGRALSEQDIAHTVSLPETELIQIRNGETVVSRKWISALVEQYMLNPIYLFAGEGRPILGLKLKVDMQRIKDAQRALRAKEPVKV